MDKSPPSDSYISHTPKPRFKNRDVVARSVDMMKKHANRTPMASCLRSDNSVRFDRQTGRKEEDRMVIDQPFGMKIESQFSPGDRQMHHLDWNKKQPRRLLFDTGELNFLDYQLLDSDRYAM